MWQNAEGYCLERVRHVATSSKALGQQSRPAGPSVKPVRPAGSQSLPARPVGPSIEPVRPPSIPAGPKGGEIPPPLPPPPPSFPSLPTPPCRKVRAFGPADGSHSSPISPRFAPQGLDDNTNGPQGHQAMPAGPQASNRVRSSGRPRGFVSPAAPQLRCSAQQNSSGSSSTCRAWRL